jgi:hypothetical protein
MSKFTFKKTPRAGRWASFDLETHEIKLKGKQVGMISEVGNRSMDPEPPPGMAGKFRVSFTVEDPLNRPAGRKWIRLKAVFDNAQEAREWLNAHAEELQKKFPLHALDTGD